MNALSTPADFLPDTNIMCVWKPPFGQGRTRKRLVDANGTVSQIVASFPNLPRDFFQRGHVLVDGRHDLDRRYWGRTRLHAGVSIVLTYPLAGGGGGDNRKGGILALIIGVATLLTAGAAAAGWFGTYLGAGFGPGALGAKLLAGGISMIGALAQSALSAPPAQQQQAKLDQAKGAASASGNLLQRGAPIPRVIGTRYVYPALAAQPLITRVNGDEIAEAVFILSGPHKLEDIRLGDTPIADADGIEYEVREGWPDDQPIDLVKRYSALKSSQLELAGHKVDGDDQQLIENQADPTRSLPPWVATSSAAEADEVHLDLSFVGGLFASTSTDRQRVAFRLRMRRSPSDPWINLPELHYASNEQREIRASVVLTWAAAPEAIPGMVASEGWVAVYTATPAQASPTSDGWTADPSFRAGSGDDAMYAGHISASGVRRVTADRWQVTIYLDPASIPRGAYDIELQRSITVRAADFDTAAYTLSGNRRDLFWYVMSGGQARTTVTREGKSDRIYLMRSTSIANRHPVKGGAPGCGLALIAVRATNRQIDNLRVKASGYVRDWDGTGWNTWTTTSNPAPHFKDVLDGLLAAEPIAAEIIDNDSLVGWRQACIDAGYTCDMIAEGAGVPDVLTTIAGCGYARPRMSETWGVIRDYDRSAEEPVQIFTSRNSRGLTMSKAMPKLPDALRVTFKDASNKDADKEIVVWRPGREGKPRPKIEAVTYDGIATEAAARRRALYDFGQMVWRSAFWNFEAPAEAAKARRGSLIAVNHAVLDRQQASARIRDTEIVDGKLTALLLDSPVQIFNEPMMEAVADMTAVADMALVGMQSGVSVRDADGDQIAVGRIAGVTGKRRRLTLATPINLNLDGEDEPLIREDNLAWIYSIANVSRRLIVANVEYDEDLVASISGVAEAPKLFAA